MSKVALEKLAAAIENLQAQVRDLTERLARLESAQAPEVPEPISVPDLPSAEAAAPATAAASPGETDESITPEVLLAISAAVAAYLGERAHVRAVRLIGTTRWSQEGRVSIQASHQLNRG
jgi:methylmalonyl-CoA carboxyltransferase large subunit